MIYRLTPVDAFDRSLVKGVCVDSVQAEANLNGAYVRLESAKADPYSAKITIGVRQKDGIQKRKAFTARQGADLFQKSGGNADCENGWIVSNIGTAEGQEFVECQNREQLELGETRAMSTRRSSKAPRSAVPSLTIWIAGSSCGLAA
ncbi:hypothetical protein [Paraeggerthella sp. Marseille-Q4926]|uniref:hypothetical protein n=1 Tax=Paraeggerthella sp. Marseille-Q4926 TaxID=2866587 RepID=UPI001CE45BA4|nr:hypothetical protein [Paraeggerthella sp. Marseille-Q4926]